MKVLILSILILKKQKKETNKLGVMYERSKRILRKMF